MEGGGGGGGGARLLPGWGPDARVLPGAGATQSYRVAGKGITVRVAWCCELGPDITLAIQRGGRMCIGEGTRQAGGVRTYRAGR